MNTSLNFNVVEFFQYSPSTHVFGFGSYLSLFLAIQHLTHLPLTFNLGTGDSERQRVLSHTVVKLV